MTFSRDDIVPAGRVPDTTAFEYVVQRDGNEIGRVRMFQAPGLINSGEDPQDYIAQRLNEVQESEGFDRLAESLSMTLQM